MEVWKSVSGTGDAYEVSNYGRVRSKNRVLRRKNGVNCRIDGRILLQRPNNRGYMRVQLCYSNGKRTVLVHRLVAESFVPNGNGRTCVNHKDFDPQNNAASNLEWVSHRENMRYSLERGRFDRTEAWRANLKKTLDAKMGKPVIGTSLTTGGKRYYTALNDCTRDGFQPSCVSNCCNGKRHTHKGFSWQFMEVSP